MLPSPAIEGSQRRTSVLGPSANSCEAQRDLVPARARVKHLNRHDCRAVRSEPAF